MKTIKLYVNAIQHPIEKPPIILAKPSDEKPSSEKPPKSQPKCLRDYPVLNSISK